jgi:hypothetical protein
MESPRFAPRSECALLWVQQIPCSKGGYAMFRTWWKKTLNQKDMKMNFRRTTRLRAPYYRPRLEILEERRLFSISLAGVPSWVEMGPDPIENGQGFQMASPNNAEVGAIESIAAEPTGPGTYIVYAGTVNGGIWRSDNITDGMFALQNGQPVVDPKLAEWRPLTDNQPSLSTSSMALDPNDSSGNTLWVGTGSISSAGIGRGGPGVGLLKTADGGNTWTDLGKNDLQGQEIVKVLPTTLTDSGSGSGHGGQIVLVATRYGNSQNGIYWSGDGGQNFVNAAGKRAPVLSGQVSDVVADPNSPGTFYAALPGQGIFLSTDNGKDWVLPSYLPTTGLTDIQNSVDLRLAVAPGGLPTTLWVLTVDPEVNKVTSPHLLISNTRFSVITSFTEVASNFSGFDDTSGTHDDLAADPTNPSIAYVGTGAAGGVGPVVDRIDISSSPVSVVRLACLNTPQCISSPHSDSRGLAFLNPTTLLEADDGGIYGITDVQNIPDGGISASTPPGSNPGWISLNGDLNGLFGIRDTEFFSVAYDPLKGVIIGGSQDNGTELQRQGSVIWDSIQGSDGGTVAADPTITTSAGNDTQLYMIASGELSATPESAPSPQHVAFMGLNSADANTTENGSPDFSFPYVLNTVSGQTNPEPMLLGITGIYEGSLSGTINIGFQVRPLMIVNNLSPLDATGEVMTGNVKGLAYGSLNNGLAAYFTTDTGQIWVRNNPGKTFALVQPTASSDGVPSTATKIVMDPNDYHFAYVVDASNNVWQLQLLDNGQPTSSGGTVQALFQNITGNLSSVANLDGTINLQALEIYHPAGSNPVVLVGGLGGVYRGLLIGSSDNDAHGYVWSQYGTNPGGPGLPNVTVTDLHYIPSSDILLAGTLGRGAWVVANASATLAQPATLVINADAGGPNVIRLVLDPVKTTPQILDVFQNNSSQIPNFRIFVTWISDIQVNSLGIQTTLIVDENNGLIDLPSANPSSQLQFFGGSGMDSFVVNDQQDTVAEKLILGTGQISGLGAGLSFTNVSQVELDTGAARNTVFVQQTAGSVTIQCGGPDTVDVHDANGVQDIQGVLTVNGVFDQPTLLLDDTEDLSSQSFTVTDTAVTNLAPAVINYSLLANLEIATGQGNNAVKVLNTAPPIRGPKGEIMAETVTQIGPGFGHGSLVATVLGTQSQLILDRAFFVGVGNGTLQNILGKITVLTSVRPIVVLLVDDHADPIAEQAHLGRGQSFNYQITGLAHVPIIFGKGVGLTVEGFGPGGTFTVDDTLPGSETAIDSTGTVNVLGTTGDLGVQGGTLVDVGLGNVQNINGQVTVSEPLFDFVDHVPLIVDDSADTQSRIVTTGQAFGNEYSITGLAPAAIDYVAGNVQSVTIDAGNVVGVGNSITVNGTPAGTALTISSGLENDVTTFVVPGIGGPVTLNTHVGDTTYLFDGPATDNSRVYTVNTGSVTRTGGFSLTVNYPAVPFFDEGFALFTGNPFNDTVNVQSTASGTSWFFDANSGANTYNIGDPVQGLDPIQGQVKVNGQGADTLNYLDQGAAPGRNLNYTIDANQMSRAGTATVTYLGMATVNIDAANAGSTGTNTLFIAATASGSTYNVNAGTGVFNEFAVSNNSNLDGIQGVLNLHGLPGPGNNDFAIVSDFLNLGVHTYTLTTGELQRDGISPLLYDHLTLWEVFIGQGADTVNILSAGAGMSTVVAANDTNTVTVGTPTGGGQHTLQNILSTLLVVARTSMSGQGASILLDDSGNPSSAPRTVTFANDPFGYRIRNLAPGDLYLRPGNGSLATVIGDGGNETFAFQDLPANMQLTLDGGGGTNTLDYSQYVGDVTVDLPLGVATGLAGITNIQNVTGSQGNDLIVGDANPNVLIGGTGRNILIGGAGSDTLTGSVNQDNMLIGGTTLWDTNLSDLMLIMIEWLRTDLNFDERMSDISSGGVGIPNSVLTGTGVALNNTTVFHDNVPDTLIEPITNTTGRYWFFIDKIGDDIVPFSKHGQFGDHFTKV